MAHQPSHMRFSIASASEIERTARYLMALRERYLTTGTLTGYVPRPLILQSWQRCQAMQVNPGTRVAALAVAHEAELQAILDANALLLRAASPVLSSLVDLFAGSGYAIVLSDARGCLLQVVGDGGIIRHLARIDFVPGGKWSEETAGTNAIGTALADGHVVQLLAAEHFCDGWQDLTCTAAPIRHPATGEIIGALNVTGNYRLIRPFLTSFLVASALEVQQALRVLLAGRDKYARTAVFSFSGPDSSRLMMNTHLPSYSHNHEPLFVPPVEDMQQSLRANDAERLARAAGTISASLDSQVALEVIAEQTAHLLLLDAAAVALFKDAADELSLHIWSKHRPGWLEPVDALASLFHQAREAIALISERGEPVIVDDVLSATTLPHAFYEQMRIRSMVLFPLVTARGVIGFLLAPKLTPYHWLVDDVRSGLALSAQAATAIENAWLFSSLQLHTQRIELLNTIAQCLNTLPDPNQCLDVVLECIVAEMDLDAGIILLSDQNTGNLTVVAHNGLSTMQVLDGVSSPLKYLYNVARPIIASGESFLMCGTEHDGRGVREAVGISELMAVPLMASTAIIGVLLVVSCKARGLSGEDLALFTTIGQQIGLNLKNAQLLRSMGEVEALREADRLKSSFLAAVSHDLRSPLTAIRTSVESLLDVHAVHSHMEHEHLLHNIAGQTSRLGQLVDQLLDLSRIEAGALPLDRDWTELPVLLADTITKFEQLNNGCHVERALPPSLPLHYVDPTRFAQVIWNLLENAHKYDAAHTTLRVEAALAGNEVRIAVSDRGPGIPASEREKIFQNFYRLNRDKRVHTQSSGLGLAICRGIVEAHNGRIWVEDRPGGGSSFLIALPLPEEVNVGAEVPDEHELLRVYRKEKRDGA